MLCGSDYEVAEVGAASEAIRVKWLRQLPGNELAINGAVHLIFVEAVIDDKASTVVGIGFHEPVLLEHVGAEEVTAPMRIVLNNRVRITNLVVIPFTTCEPGFQLQEGDIRGPGVAECILLNE